MVQVKRIYDPRIILAVAEEMWDTIVDDSPITIEDFEPPMDDLHRWYATYDDDELVSVWYLHQLNHIMWQLHIHYRPKYWGTGVSTAHAKAALKKVWVNTKAKKLYATIPDYAKPVLDLAKRTGFKQEGRIKRAYQKDGILYDLIQIGVYK
jgi:RimJ/RimL family protein N-acetyltransferase